MAEAESLERSQSGNLGGISEILYKVLVVGNFGVGKLYLYILTVIVLYVHAMLSCNLSIVNNALVQQSLYYMLLLFFSFHVIYSITSKHYCLHITGKVSIHTHTHTLCTICHIS